MTRFKMLARDINSNPTQYRTWVVPNTPDLTAQFYTGLKSGTNPFVDFSAYALLDDNSVADFCLPDPTSWYAITDQLNWDFPVRQVLPFPMEDSHLAVIDGYAYMFGGKITDKIYRADINNPDKWFDTGAVLPDKLYAAKLAILDGYIYLFGGNNGNETSPTQGAMDTIFRAPVSDPLSWTDLGSHLPRRLFYSNLGIAGSSLYLFGGREINSASDVIFTAPISDPTNWSDTGARLPFKVYGSMFGQVNGNWMIFGGQLFPDTVTNVIMSASVSSPTVWTITGLLPWSTAHGQFINIGGDGYIFGPMNGAYTGFTSILRANLLVSPNAWVDLQVQIPGAISHSQMALIYDRVWLFGGSGETAMFTCNQILKYNPFAPKAVNYGAITRTTLQATSNLHDPYQALSIPYWLTDLPFTGRP
jgi:hypothetical protein